MAILVRDSMTSDRAMQRARPNHAVAGWGLGFVFLFFLLGLRLDAAAPSTETPPGDHLPAASNVICRIVERADRVARAGKVQRYVYDKRAVVEELDAEGGVVKSSAKVYHVDLIGGLPFPRLVKIEGRELTEKEVERETRREEEFRQKVTRFNSKQQAEQGHSWITDELVNRFEFVPVKREFVRGRPALVLTFTSKTPPSDDGSLQERILTRLGGTIWVDEEDYEVARLDASLNGTISMGWFGLIGSLNRCQLLLERARMPEGVWANTKQTIWIVARKLFGAKRYKSTEESSGFRASGGAH